MSDAAPALFTIPAGAPFADLLVRGLRARIGASPDALADAIVLVPTRRAVRALREAFLRASEGRPLLLPRMEAIGDIDDDEMLLTPEITDVDLAPAISPVERLAVLTEMVRLRPEVAGDPGLACRLATSLATLLDSAALEEIDLQRLNDVVRSDLAIHWQRSLEILEIIRDAWPGYLAARGLADPAMRRVQLLRARIATFTARPPRGFIVAAGSTGSMPATADLLAAIARLPDGAVVLPGLDTALDAQSWLAAHDDPAHPQHGLARLLRHIGVERDAVRPWPGAAPDAARVRLLSEALRPASTTPAWSHLPQPARDAFAGLTRIEAPTQQDEALLIALVMRETVETPARTAALVTPDRQLARRVSVELARWGLVVDDSGGAPLLRTPPGAFLRATAAFACDPGAPVELLAALKHPLACGGMTRGAFLGAVRRLERKALRGLRPGPGLAGLRRAVVAAHDPESLAFVDGVSIAVAPLVTALQDSAIAPAELLAAHIAFMEFLASPADLDETALWSGDAGEALRDALLDLETALDVMSPIRGRAWPGLLDALLESRVVRPRVPAHPRLSIWGPLEARMQAADVIVLGGLNEGVWPPDIGDDPWLSRPMRKALGLPPAERRIGLSAHDFVQAAAGPTVVLSFSRKLDGVPAAPSRWLQRLSAFLGKHPAWADCIDATRLDWAAAIDRPAASVQVARPSPRPPVAARPRKLAVTAIETLVRDPYAIYVRHVLGLKPLDALDEVPGGGDRGTAVHVALRDLLNEIGRTLPEDALALLLKHGRAAYAPLLDRPVVRAIWWPRFERLAQWFVAWERRRRAAGVMPLAVEITGLLVLPAATGVFTLEARADRIDLLPDGRASILDYKTGRVPSGEEVLTGFAPQLPLEAAIARAAGFPGVAAIEPGELLHLRLTGGEPAGEEKPLAPKRDTIIVTPDVLATDALKGLTRLIASYGDPATPYLARPRVRFLRDRGDYDHLARVAEWSAGGEEE